MTKLPQDMMDRLAARLDGIPLEHISRVAHAFAADLAEHPIVPTNEQLKSMENARLDLTRTPTPDPEAWLCEEWQRRMFAAPEPEVPKEIADFMTTWTDEPLYWTGRQINQNILEAFRRGKKSKETR